MGTYALRTPALKGWKCDEVKGRVLDELAGYVQKNIPREESLLIFSDLQILYALTARESYRGIPIFVLRKNHMPVPGAQLEKVKAYIHQHLPQWIIADINAYFSEIPYVGLSPEIKNYTVEVALGQYMVFRRNTVEP